MPLTLTQLRSFLETHLRNDIVPFWLKHAIDRERGGIFSCIADDGTIQSRDKSIWSQARGLWTFSALFNRIEKRKEWLEVAHGLFRFLQAHGRDEKGYWVFTTDEFGKVVKGEDSIVTDAFAIMGMTEYAIATGSKEAKRIARETYDSVRERLARPGTYKTAPYPTPPGMKAHRERMQFSLAFYFLGKLLEDERIRLHGESLGREVLDQFVRWDRRVLLEYLGIDRQPQDTPAGRCMVPGHGIESCYFQILIFSDAHQPDQAARACRPIQWCLEKGWDKKYGGLFLAIDAEGREPVYWKNAEKKNLVGPRRSIGGVPARVRTLSREMVSRLVLESARVELCAFSRSRTRRVDATARSGEPQDRHADRVTRQRPVSFAAGVDPGNREFAQDGKEGECPSS